MIGIYIMQKPLFKHLHPNVSNFFTDRLFMTQEAYLGFITQMMFSSESGNDIEIPKYSEVSMDLADRLTTGAKSDEISITTSFKKLDIPDNSIALHRIQGPIFAEYDRWGWYFSTKQFIDDLRTAEQNPQITSHMFFANSGGGEAWYLEKAFAAVSALEKPNVAFVEKRACSACEYIILPSDYIISTSINDTHGSIGVMVAFWDMIPYFEKAGFKYIEEYANQSKLKNKKFNDLRNGKAKKYKEKELDPLAEQFIAAARSGRKQLGDLPEDHDVFAGETYSAQESRPVGLIDEVNSIEFALNYTLDQGKKYKAKIEKQSKMQSLIN